MATISDTVKTGSGRAGTGKVVFYPSQPPIAGSTGFITGDPVVAMLNSSGAFTVDLEPGDYRVAYRRPNGVDETSIRVPHGSGTYTIEALTAVAASDLQAQIIAWTEAEAFSLLSPSYDPDGIISDSPVSWPDGATGHFTTTQSSEGFFAVDAFTVTYVSGPTTYTVTQAAVVRNSDGDITSRPALTIA